MNEGQPSGFEMHPCWNRIGELLGSVDFFDLTLENLNACFTLVNIKSSHLQRIVFEGTRLQDNHLVIIADNCQGLKSFSSDAGSAVEVSDFGLKAIAEKCHQLVEFKVEDGFYGNNGYDGSNNGITKEGFGALIRANPNLESLSLNSLDNLSDDWIG